VLQEGEQLSNSSVCFRSESALLKSDKDKYWISPCKVEKGVMWVVLELNEIIHVRTIVIGSYEYYSSTPHRFQVYTAYLIPINDIYRYIQIPHVEYPLLRHRLVGRLIYFCL